MGVPGFFAWLIKKYRSSNLIRYHLETQTDCLYIDANCLIHPQVRKVLDKYPNFSDKDNIEEKMLDRIVDYIKFLVKYVRPTKLVYIAVDGVCPVAKVNQQRTRRFKAVKNNKMIDELKNKYNVPINSTWNTASITPGTEFMYKITNKLKDFIKDEEYLKKYKGVSFVFSSANTPGEGEHKILQHINNSPKCPNTQMAIYGLDADLFFLALASKRENIFLLREVQYFGTYNEPSLLDDCDDDIYEELCYLSIDSLRQHLYDEILLRLDNVFKPLINDVVNDFILLSFFLGNDFLPHIPSIDIKHKGLDLLLNSYIHTFCLVNCDKEKDFIHFLDKKLNIQKVMLLPFLKFLIDKEDESLRKMFLKGNKIRFFKKCPFNDPFNKAKFDLENLKFQIDDPICLGKDEPVLWRYRYYEHYFKTGLNQQSLIDSICKHYINGLDWIAKYYLDECHSWTWFYPYHHAPFIYDLYTYVSNNDITSTIIDVINDRPFEPVVHLLTVLHPECNHLLPINFRKLVTDIDSPIIDLYPIDFDEDMIGKHMLWQCVPFLPILNINRIINATKNIQLTEQENERNKEMDIFK